MPKTLQIILIPLKPPLDAVETARIANKIQIPFIVVEEMKNEQGNTVKNRPDFCHKEKRKLNSRKQDEMEMYRRSTMKEDDSKRSDHVTCCD